jgi:hypothetical protein
MFNSVATSLKYRVSFKHSFFWRRMLRTLFGVISRSGYFL